jgi:hypothetical protein
MCICVRARRKSKIEDKGRARRAMQKRGEQGKREEDEARARRVRESEEDRPDHARTLSHRCTHALMHA